MEDSYAHLRESTQSISAFSLSLLGQLLDQILPFDYAHWRLVPVILNPRYRRRQSSSIVFDHHRRSSAQCRSLSLAQWISPIRMTMWDSYAHMTESTESISPFSFASASASASVRSALCLFINSRLVRPSRSSVYLSLCTPSFPNRRLELVRSRDPFTFT
jgi:hypothetical protein